MRLLRPPAHTTPAGAHGRQAHSACTAQAPRPTHSPSPLPATHTSAARARTVMIARAHPRHRRLAGPSPRPARPEHPAHPSRMCKRGCWNAQHGSGFSAQTHSPPALPQYQPTHPGRGRDGVAQDGRIDPHVLQARHPPPISAHPALPQPPHGGEGGGGRAEGKAASFRRTHTPRALRGERGNRGKPARGGLDSPLPAKAPIHRQLRPSAAVAAPQLHLLIPPPHTHTTRTRLPSARPRLYLTQRSRQPLVLAAWPAS